MHLVQYFLFDYQISRGEGHNNYVRCSHSSERKTHNSGGRMRPLTLKSSDVTTMTSSCTPYSVHKFTISCTPYDVNV